jgi:hypothetical protein
MKYLLRSIALLTFALLVTVLPGWGQIKASPCDEIANLHGELDDYEPPQVRWQDETLTPFERGLLRLRQKAIPMLIGCLTDDRQAHVQYWLMPATVGQVAFSMLWDLFTASMDEPPPRDTMEGPIGWDELCAEGPPHVAFPCAAGWEEHLKRYGPRSIQQSWQKAWTENKHRIYWDESAKCFRVKKKP